jgi:hypothetical protein
MVTGPAGVEAAADGATEAGADAAADGLEPELEHAPNAMTATLARTIHRPVVRIFKAIPPLL